MTATVPGRCPLQPEMARLRSASGQETDLPAWICRPRWPQLRCRANSTRLVRADHRNALAAPGRATPGPDTDTAPGAAWGRPYPPQRNVLCCYRREPCRPGIRAPVSNHILSRAASRDDEDACPHWSRQTGTPLPCLRARGICREGVSLSRSGLPLAAADRARRLPDTPARCPRQRAASAVRRRGRDRPLSTTSIR